MTKVSTSKTLVIAAGLVLAATLAHADLRRYELVLTVDSVAGASDADCMLRAFGCINVGDTFRGGFSVDSSALAVDGIVNAAAVQDFFLPYGRGIYSTGADNTLLYGFRDLLSSGAAGPGLLVAGGEVVDLLGGVFARLDVPFIDFGYPPSPPRNRFSAYDGMASSGTLQIMSAVPEPEAWPMTALGSVAVLLGSLLLKRRRMGTAVAHPRAIA